MEIKDNKLTWEFENQKFKMPSDKFPLPDREDIYVFTEDNTEKYENKELKKEIDKLNTTVGKCYTNTEKIVQAGKKLGIDIEYMGGWIFPRGPIPIHHAWAVIEQKHVIDLAYSKKLISARAFLDFENNPEQAREVYAERIKDIYKLPTSERCVFGKMLPEFIYIGVKSSKMELIKQFNKLRKQYPNHISYKNNNSLDGRSNFQKMLHKKGVE